MSKATDIELLLRLSLSIGESMDLEPMLRRFLIEMQRALTGAGAAVLQFHQTEAAGIGVAPVVCMVPEELPRHPCYSAFWERWSPDALDRALSERTDDLPVVVLEGDCAVHSFRLPGFGVLIFVRADDAGALPADMQQALHPLMLKLANAARACLLEAELRRQTQRLQLAADAGGIGIWEWDPISGHLDWDNRTHALFGRARATGVASLDDWLQHIHADDQAQVRNAIAEAVRDKDQLDVEYKVTRPDDTIRCIRTQAVLVRSPVGDPERMTGVSLDITDAKRLEDALRQSRDMAESANRAKSRFIANMTHEIRTPLNGILGLTELALDTDLSTTQRDYLELMRRSADTLLRILNDILDIAKIDAGRMQIEEIPFSAPIMLEELLAQSETHAAAKGLSFAVEQSGELSAQSIGDPGRIRQALNNLLDNAIKFTERGEIRVQVRLSTASDTQSDTLEIEIQDTGIGIPPDKLTEIFAAFNQGDGVITRQFGGTGLGLSISARLIALMGGVISVESRPGEGSIFSVKLPLARTEAAMTPLPPMQQWPGRHAMIVDAHPVSRRTLVYWFKQWGFSVHAARSGRQALELAHQRKAAGHPIDVYIFDAALPELDGFALAGALTEAKLAEQSRMIMVSSSGQRGDAQRCRELGIGAFLTKPATPLELRETLTHFLGTDDAHKASGQLLTRHHLIEHRQRLRILLVDDNEVGQKLAGSLLREWGHDVIVVGDGQTAIDLCRTERFHLIFMDLYMPELDGIAATRAIRELEQSGERVPIIAMTVHALESDASRCLEAGMDEHITKPLQPSVLEEIVLRFANTY